MLLPEEGPSAPSPKRNLSTRTLVFIRVAVAIGLGAILSIAYFAAGAFGFHDTPVNIGGGSIYGSVGTFHFFHEDTKEQHFHAGRNFAKDSQILLTCVSQPPNGQVQQVVTIPIQDATTWNLRISTQDAQLNVKENVSSACSNGDCSLSNPIDPNGNIHIFAKNPPNDNGWDISTFGGELTYFDNSTSSPGCVDAGGVNQCLHLTYLTLELPAGYPPLSLPSACTTDASNNYACKYACDGGKCQVYMGGPTSTEPTPNPPVCP
jgi:hypothetical protein